MADHKIILQGPFTDEQLAELLAFLRRCDETHPTATWGLWVFADDGMTAEQMQATIERGWPARPDRHTEIDVYRIPDGVLGAVVTDPKVH